MTQYGKQDSEITGWGKFIAASYTWQPTVEHVWFSVGFPALPCHYITVSTSPLPAPLQIHHLSTPCGDVPPWIRWPWSAPPQSQCILSRSRDLHLWPHKCGYPPPPHTTAISGHFFDRQRHLFHDTTNSVASSHTTFHTTLAIFSTSRPCAMCFHQDLKPMILFDFKGPHTFSNPTDNLSTRTKISVRIHGALTHYAPGFSPCVLTMWVNYFFLSNMFKRCHDETVF